MSTYAIAGGSDTSKGVSKSGSNAASPILGHPKNMKLGITRSADKAFHVTAASPILDHPKNMKVGITRSADKAFQVNAASPISGLPVIIPNFPLDPLKG